MVSIILKNQISSEYQPNQTFVSEWKQFFSFIGCKDLNSEQMIYDYVTGNEFKEQLKAVVEGFTSMRESINQERIQMEKLWKSREKHLDKILLNATHITGSIEGISGLENSSMYMLDDEEE